MSFDHLIGNDSIKKQLTQMLSRGHIGQSFLFGGISGIGKADFAYSFARELLEYKEKENFETHPDLFLFRGEGRLGLHSMENLRTLCRECRQAPFQAKKRVFIIEQADRMLPTSANALLKSFEEPAATSVIILVTDHPEILLETILSRCQRLFFRGISTQDLVSYLKNSHNLDTETANCIAKQAQGSIARALEQVYGKGQEIRKLVISTLWAAQCNQMEQVQNGCLQLAQLMEKLREEEEVKLRKLRLPEESRDWGAVQCAAIEQTIIGGGTVCYQRSLDSILETVLSFCRDLHAFSSGAELINVDCNAYFAQFLERREPPSLEKVLEITEKTHTGLQRSMSLIPLLESLFLSI